MWIVRSIDQLELNREQKIKEADALRSRVRQGALKSSDDVDALVQQRGEISARLIELSNLRRFRLNAEQTGTVSAITVRPGSIVAGDQALFAIIPRNATPRIELYVPVDRLGELEIGSEVEIEVAAYPYQRFGTMRAKVYYVSRAAIAVSSGEGPSQLRSWFRLNCRRGGPREIQAPAGHERYGRTQAAERQAVPASSRVIVSWEFSSRC